MYEWYEDCVLVRAVLLYPVPGTGQFTYWWLPKILRMYDKMYNNYIYYNTIKEEEKKIHLHDAFLPSCLCCCYIVLVDGVVRSEPTNYPSFHAVLYCMVYYCTPYTTSF